MPKTSVQSFRFILFTLAVLVAWGLSWPIMKLALQHIPPVWLGALRMGIGTFVLFIALIISGRNIRLNRHDMFFLFVIGFLQMCIFTLLVNLGLMHVEAGRSAILVYTTPLWVTPMAVFIFKEPLYKLTALGLVVGLIGVWCLFNPLHFNWHDKTALYGNALLLLAAFVWACTIVYVRFSGYQRSVLEIMPWQMLLGTIFLTIAASLLEPYPHIHWSWSFVLEMSYIGPIATAFAFWGNIELNRRLPATNMSLILLAVPVIGLISSALVLGEVITMSMLLAMVFLLVGLGCVIFTNVLNKT